MKEVHEIIFGWVGKEIPLGTGRRGGRKLRTVVTR